MNTKCCVTERVTGSGVMCDLCVIVTHHDRPQEIAWLSQLDLVIDESCWLHHVSCLRSVAGKTLFYLWSGPGGAHHPHRVINGEQIMPPHTGQAGHTPHGRQKLASLI